MATMEVEVELYHAHCENCGRDFVFPDLAHDEDLLLGLSSRLEAALVDDASDPVVGKVRDLVELILEQWGATETDMVVCLGRVLGNAFDPAPSGLGYDFSGELSCPLCGSDRVAYSPYKPAHLQTIRLPLATHSRWSQMDYQEQADLVMSALYQKECIPRLGEPETPGGPSH